jgi:hypothetical protein
VVLERAVVEPLCDIGEPLLDRDEDVARLVVEALDESAYPMSLIAIRVTFWYPSCVLVLVSPNIMIMPVFQAVSQGTSMRGPRILLEAGIDTGIQIASNPSEYVASHTGRLTIASETCFKSPVSTFSGHADPWPEHRVYRLGKYRTLKAVGVLRNSVGSQPLSVQRCRHLGSGHSVIIRVWHHMVLEFFGWLTRTQQVTPYKARISCFVSLTVVETEY